MLTPMSASVTASWGDGTASLWGGFRFLGRRPRLALLGAVPPAFTSLFLGGALIMLAWNSGGLATWATPFADGWAEGMRQGLRAAVAVMTVVAGAALSVLVFVWLTLTLGAPIYDRLSEEAERASGGVAGRVGYPASQAIPREIGHTAVAFVQSVALSVVLFFVGLVPVVGTVAAAVLGAVGGGWFLARELAGGPLERRGIPRLRDWGRFVRVHWRAGLGFGVPVYLLMLVPVVAIFAFPAATVGGTLLVRRLWGESLPR